MLNELKQDAEARMKKAVEALHTALKKVRTGRAHPSLLDDVMVSYYGSPTPIRQVANLGVEDGRTITVTPWERGIASEIEKAIRSANLGLNPSSNGDLIRVPLPALTEESRRDLLKIVKSDGEQAKVAVRAARRDANSDVKELLKEKEISEDDQRRSEDEIQKLTDKYVKEIDQVLAEKESELMTI